MKIKILKFSRLGSLFESELSLFTVFFMVKELKFRLGLFDIQKIDLSGLITSTLKTSI